MENQMKVLSQFYPARRCEYLTWPEKQLLSKVVAYGGFYNAHAHLDRANTLQDEYLANYGLTPLSGSSKPLEIKQNIVGNLHLDKGYTEDDLRQRMSNEIQRQYDLGVRKLDTLIDATPDLPEDGLFAIRVALELKEVFKSKVDLRVAPHPVFGFKRKSGRWETFFEAAKLTDFVSLLPEKDDYSDIRSRDGKVGFGGNIRRGFDLACELGKEIHLHLDQANHPDERGTEILIDGLDQGWVEAPHVEGNTGPAIWVIHMISPSAYADESRYAALVDGLLRHNIGVIVCPSAAISMRQLRSVVSPTHTCMARLDLVKRKVPVRLGSDNIVDVFVPFGDGDMLSEIKIAANALRMVNISVWAKLATGTPLNSVDIAAVGEVLYEDRKAFMGVNSRWTPAFD